MHSVSELFKKEKFNRTHLRILPAECFFESNFQSDPTDPAQCSWGVVEFDLHCQQSSEKLKNIFVLNNSVTEWM
jgi:hypothetical protein